MTPPPDYAEVVARAEALIASMASDKPRTIIRDLLAIVRQQREIVERIMPKVCDLCSHHGSSPESIEDFDRSGEDQWIADLWREAAALAAREQAEGGG